MPIGIGSTAVLMEPFSTPAFKVLVWIFAITTMIYTCGGFTLDHAPGFSAYPGDPPTRRRIGSRDISHFQS